MAAGHFSITTQKRITIFGLFVLIFSSVPAAIGGALFLLSYLVADLANALGEFLDTGIGTSILILGRTIIIFGGSLGTIILLWSLFVWKTRGQWFYYAMHAACVGIFLCDKGIILAVVVYYYLRFNKPEFFVTPRTGTQDSHRDIGE